MNDLFRLYRYLANNRHMTNEENSYNVAYRALDSYLEMEREMSCFAEKIASTGGLSFDEANALSKCVITGFETGLNTYHGTPLLAAIDFMQKYIGLHEIGDLIEACKREQSRMHREEDEEDEIRAHEKRQFLLDSGSMIEDQ